MMIEMRRLHTGYYVSETITSEGSSLAGSSSCAAVFKGTSKLQYRTLVPDSPHGGMMRSLGEWIDVPDVYQTPEQASAVHSHTPG